MLRTEGWHWPPWTPVQEPHTVKLLLSADWAGPLTRSVFHPCYNTARPQPSLLFVKGYGLLTKKYTARGQNAATCQSACSQYTGDEGRLQSPTAWVRIPAQPLTGSVTTGKLLHLCASIFSSVHWKE